MQAVAQLVTEFFMMVLCLASSPPDQKDIRIDVVGDRGYIDTLIAQRTDAGWTVWDETNGKRAEVAKVTRVEGMQDAYVADSDGKKETVRLSDTIVGFDPQQLRSAARLTLKAKDGTIIKLNRSGPVVFLTASSGKRTYVVH